MGVMRFLVHPPAEATHVADYSRCFLSGLDGRVFNTRVDLQDSTLILKRGANDSAKVSLPWSVPGFGRPVITTTSLRESEDPYLLAHELARGKLSDVREHAAAWQMGGLTVSEEYLQMQQRAFQAFAVASAARYVDLDTCWRKSCECIELACRAGGLLMSHYVEQRLASIRQLHPRTAGLFGIEIDDSVHEPEVARTLEGIVNAAAVRIDWRDIEPEEGTYHWAQIDRHIEFCSERKLVVQGGPVINLGPQGLPAWLARWKDDFLNLPSFVCDFVETAISRYTGLVRLWEVAAYGNTGGALELGEDHRLALVARVLEAAKRTDSDAQYFIRIDQPWGEYQSQGRHRLSPFQFADALIRSNLGLAGISLELNAGYAGGACLPQDLMSISRMIDRWSMLGVQLHIHLACPSSASPDPLASSHLRVVDRGLEARWDDEAQAHWLEQLIPLLRAKGAVTATFLSQVSDAQPHRFPHAGVFDAEGHPKPVVETLLGELHPDRC